MENLLISQKFSLVLILVPGFLLGIILGFAKRNAWVWLLKYGAIVCLLGILTSAVFKSSIKDTLLLIDTEGFGRAYVVGCMLIVSGVISVIVKHVHDIFFKEDVS